MYNLNKAAQERVNDEYSKRGEVFFKRQTKTTRKSSQDFEKLHSF